MFKNKSNLQIVLGIFLIFCAGYGIIYFFTAGQYQLGILGTSGLFLMMGFVALRPVPKKEK